MEASPGLGLTSQEIATLLLRALSPVNQSFVITDDGNDDGHDDGDDDGDDDGEDDQLPHLPT